MIRNRARPAGLALTAALVAAAVTVATASGSAVPVTLSLAGVAKRDAGQSARLTARAKLPAGAHLIIQRFASGRAPAKIADCPGSPCRGAFRNARQELVVFRAFAVKRNGLKTTILGRSARLGIWWLVPGQQSPQPPPPPSPPQPEPTPAVTPGHYEGKTAENEAFRFDVASDGSSLSNLQTGQINESCEPALNLSGGNLSVPGPVPIAADGTFTVTGTFASTVDAAPSTNTIAIRGRISGGTASGTYRENTSFSSNGSGYTCTSGDQTWTAART